MIETNPYMQQYFATRWRLRLGLIIAGVVGGAIVGAALTNLGKIVAAVTRLGFVYEKRILRIN